MDAADEVRITDAACSRVELTDADDRATAEHHAGGIDEIKRPIGRQGAVDLRRRTAVDPGERARVARRLNKSHRLVSADVERAEVHDRAVTGSNRRARTDAREIGSASSD